MKSTIFCHIVLCFIFITPNYSQATFVEGGFNLSGTYVKRIPKDSPIGTLADRDPIPGFHAALGRSVPIFSKFNLRYSAAYDLLGFKTLIENDMVKESYLSAVLAIERSLNKSLAFSLGGFGMTSIGGEGLDPSSPFFGLSLTKHKFFWGASGQISYSAAKNLSLYTGFNLCLSPLYTHDFQASQLPLNLRLYYSYFQIGLRYEIHD